MITDVVVVAMYSEADAISHVNAALAAAGEEQCLRPLDMSAAGGSKVITARVWAASFSYLDWSALRDALMAAPWRFPRDVTILADGDSGISERLIPGDPQ
jgi:hypothetical protein